MKNKKKTEETYPRLERRKLADLKPHPDGVRASSPTDLFQLGKSYDRFGLLRPPFVLNARTGNLLDGDVMVGVLRDRGVEEADVWVVDVPEEDEDAAHLALQNHVGEWQWQAVSVRLKELQGRGLDPRLTGFHDYDIGPLCAADWSPAEKGPLDGSDAKQEGFAFQ